MISSGSLEQIPLWSSVFQSTTGGVKKFLSHLIFQRAGTAALMDNFSQHKPISGPVNIESRADRKE